MCNLYSISTNQAAIIALFRVVMIVRLILSSGPRVATPLSVQ
jgi:hypothetical protein